MRCEFVIILERRMKIGKHDDLTGRTLLKLMDFEN
jgi:hypothetical protein